MGLLGYLRQPGSSKARGFRESGNSVRLVLTHCLRGVFRAAFFCCSS
jgi:hypothetical protein